MRVEVEISEMRMRAAAGDPAGFDPRLFAIEAQLPVLLDTLRVERRPALSGWRPFRYVLVGERGGVYDDSDMD